MTLKERIRYVTDGLEPGSWLTLAELTRRVPNTTYASVQTVITEMVRADQLERRGKPPRCEYRSGSTAATALPMGRPTRTRMGFMHLARLRESDPAAYEKAIAADRGLA